MSIDFGDVKVVGDPRDDPSGRALVLFFQGEGLVLCWQGNASLAGFFNECVGSIDVEGFALDDAVDFEVQPDGVYVAELRIVDDGPGDYPGTCEALPGLHNFRTATKAEFAAHLRGEWPWDKPPGWASVS